VWRWAGIARNTAGEPPHQLQAAARTNGRGGGAQGEQKGVTITVLGSRSRWMIDLGGGRDGESVGATGLRGRRKERCMRSRVGGLADWRITAWADWDQGRVGARVANGTSICDRDRRDRTHGTRAAVGGSGRAATTVSDRRWADRQAGIGKWTARSAAVRGSGREGEQSTRKRCEPKGR
jgi:hypothetical protein